MISYSNYPFLKKAAIGIKELDEQAILHCEKYIDKYTPTNIQTLDIPVWLISTIIMRNLENKLLIRKFVSNYSKLFENFMLRDIMIKNHRTEIMEYFNIYGPIEFLNEFFDRKPVTFIKIHMNDYLELAILSTEKNFQLINQELKQGFVYIEKQKFVYLMRLVLELKLIQKIKSMKKYTDNELINQVVNKLSELYPKSTKRIQYSGTNPTTLPLSIQQLIDLAYNTHHLNHQARIKLGLYLLSNNYDWDYIIEIYSQLSDFNLKTTTYQLNSLRRYIK